MDRMKEIWSLIWGSKLVIEGKGRTFAKMPLWTAALPLLCGRGGLKLLAVTAVLMIAFGMRADLEKM